MKKAVVYARYSSDSQTEQSIEGQLRVCNEYAERNNIEIVENYIDRAMTGTNDNRPDFKRMLADAKKKEWDYVLVYKFDRFSRNKYESVIHKKSLKDLGITVVSAMENIPDTPEGIILESLLEGLNQYYSAELSQKVKRGNRESRIKGNFHGGPRPYGYRVENLKLVIDEKEARIIRYIYKQYLLGHHCSYIAKKLRRRCIRYSTNKLFTDENVRRIINREYYTGFYCFDGEYFNNIFPPIIPRHQFRKVALLRKAFNQGGNVKELYLYRGKLFCKKCGFLFLSDGGIGKLNRHYKYYKCSNKKRNHNCDSSSYRKNELEDFLTSFIREFFNETYNLNLIAKTLLKKFQLKKNLDQLKKFEEEKVQCKDSLKNLLQAVEKGIVSSSTNDRIKFYEARISELDAEISYEKNKDNVKFQKPYIRKHFLESLKYDNYELVSYMINKIEIDEETVDIYLTCPYGNNYDTFDLIRKICYSKTYHRESGDQTISKEISILI